MKQNLTQLGENEYGECSAKVNTKKNWRKNKKKKVNKMNERTKVKAFFKEFKYEGVLVAEDEATYTLLDIKIGKVRLPKSHTVLTFLGDRNDFK